MGKGRKGADHHGELGENLPATMVLDRIHHVAGVLLKKYCEIFLSHPFKKDIKATGILVGDFVGLMRPITFIYFGTAR